MAAVLLAVLGLSGIAVAGSEHDVVGRFSIESEAGGAIWAFQPSGALIVTGPGDQIEQGAWSASGTSDAMFDASVDYQVTGQELTVLGEVSPDGAQIALFVSATPPNDEDNALPWPTEARLTGQRFGLVAEPTPEPPLDPIECLRPSWREDGSVDWDRCGLSGSSADASPSPAPSPAT